MGKPREFFVEQGKIGGNKLAAERGPEYYAELGRKGRASQLANQHLKEPTLRIKHRPSKGGSKPASAPKQAAENPDDPLLSL